MLTRLARTIVLSLALAAPGLISPAMADTLAQAVRADAQRIRPMVDQAQAAAASRPAIAPAALDSAHTGSLQLWGLNASRLAADINARKGADDLACIFRGMAEETDAQLQAASSAKTGAARAAALRKLSFMLRDAIEVAPAVDEKANAAGTGVQAASCPADRNVRF